MNTLQITFIALAIFGFLSVIDGLPKLSLFKTKGNPIFGTSKSIVDQIIEKNDQAAALLKPTKTQTILSNVGVILKESQELQEDLTKKLAEALNSTIEIYEESKKEADEKKLNTDSCLIALNDWYKSAARIEHDIEECISVKLNETSKIVDEATNITNSITDDIKELRQKKVNCEERGKRFFDSAKSMLCLEKLKSEAMLNMLVKIPVKKLKMDKQIFSLKKRRLELLDCKKEELIENVINDAVIVGKGIRKCIKDKLDSKTL